MDPIVLAALKKWPNVPDCFGWLALDARGRWRIGEQKELVSHRLLLEFIARNYASDDAGRYFFQNGPQKVYVELEATPYVFRLQPDGSLVDQCGSSAKLPETAIICSEAHLALDVSERPGLLHDHDIALILDMAENRDSWLNGGTEPELTWPGTRIRVPLERLTIEAMAKRYGYQRQPERN